MSERRLPAGQLAVTGVLMTSSQAPTACWMKVTRSRHTDGATQTAEQKVVTEPSCKNHRTKRKSFYQQNILKGFKNQYF